MNYTVVKSDCLHTLVNVVSDYRNTGWECLGGIFAVTDNRGRITYLQSMTKNTK